MFWLSLIVFEDLISVELASWWTAAVGFILRPPGRDSNPHISSLTNPRPQPLNQVDQSSESSTLLFLKKSTSCSRRNPPYVVGEIPLLVNKLLQVSSRARYSTSDELWTRGRGETKQNLQLFSRASIIQLSLFAGMNLPFLVSLPPLAFLANLTGE